MGGPGSLYTYCHPLSLCVVKYPVFPSSRESGEDFTNRIRDDDSKGLPMVICPIGKGLGKYPFNFMDCGRRSSVDQA